MANADSAQEKIENIPSDEPTDYKLKFKDGVIVDITKHDILLSGMLTDFQDTMVGSSDKTIPVENFNSEPFNVIRDAVKLIRDNDEELFLSYLNNEKHRGSMKPEYIKVFQKYQSPDIIQAANLTAFLSMELPKRVLVWYIAEYIRNYTTTIEDITNFLGATPLDEATCREHGLDETDNIWDAYPDQFKKIFGREYVKPSASGN